MAAPSGPAKTLFVSVLEDALKNYTVPEWLGSQSPLASPYLLASHLRVGDSSNHARGQCLQAVLNQSIEQIQGSNAERYQSILREYYVKGSSVAIAGEVVGLAKNSFHLNRKAAIEALAKELVSVLHPALRLELPPTVPQLLERDDAIDRCMADLGSNASIAITGSSGMGKTALAAFITTQTDAPSFWFTIRPGVNDQLESLIFALGLFCHELGESALWQELVATGGQIDSAKALGMMRYALGALSPSPLLCVDDLDFLQPTVDAQHQQLISFLEGLRGLTPQLLIAQRIPLDIDHVIQLEPLSLAAARELLHNPVLGNDAYPASSKQHQVPQEQLADYHKQTRGNPRLLHLCHTLLQYGSTPTELASLLADSPTVSVLLNRLVNQLDEAARGALMALAVYRNSAPAYVWQSPKAGAALATLLQAQLVQDDERGGVAIVPLYRALLYQSLPDEIRRQLHADAAIVRRTFGSYTAAAYHSIESGKREEAIWFWRDVQQQEIEQGQALAARAIFRPLLQQIQEAATYEALTILCSQLERFTGNLTQAAADLQATLASTPILRIEAGELAGVIANDQSEFSKAEEIMRRSLSAAEALVEIRMARIRKGLGWLYVRQRELEQADRELLLAHYEVENLRGTVAFERCLYTDAEEHYQSAQVIADETGSLEGSAKTANNLATIYLYRGQYAECQKWLTIAYSAYQEMGKTLSMAGICITKAVSYNQEENYEQALLSLQSAKRLMPQNESTTWMTALIAHAKAEAYLGLGQLDQAETHVQEAIDLEEIDILPDAYRVYGEILTQRGEFDAAHQALQHALSLAEEYADPYLCGYTWRALSQLHQKQENFADADHAKAQAIESFTEINLPNEVEKTNQL